ncbi:MAG: DNA polymerase III subunit delta [Saprospiraceae bacterium]|nr:DNA polymerase III subunit delta [Saprospiraceae bacterium]
MDYKQLIKEINQSKFKPFYLIYSEETFFSDAISQALLNDFIAPEQKDFNQIVVYGKDLTTQALIDLAREYPFMSERKLVLVKDAQDLKNLELMTPFMKKPNPQCLLVLMFAKKPDGRSGWMKEAKEHSAYVEFKSLSDYQLPAFVKSMISDMKLEIEDKALYLLLEYIGNDLGTYYNELGKLKIILNAGQKIDEQIVVKFIGISKDFNVFELQKALSFRDKSRSYWIARNMANQLKSHPLVMTIGALFNHYQRIWLTKTYSKLDDDELNKIVKLPFKSFLKEYREASSKYSMQSLEQSIGLLKQYDLKSKGYLSGAAREEDLYLELVMHLSNV